jgi:hypothetical protein
MFRSEGFHSAVVSLGNEAGESALGMSFPDHRLLNRISDEVVELRSGIGLVQRRMHHRQQLQKLKISATHGE